MPLSYFQPSPQPQLCTEGISASRSTDSTLDATAPTQKKIQGGSGIDNYSVPTPPSLSNPFRKTSPATPHGSWRTKDTMSSIFRDERIPSNVSAIESMWTVQRCNAFDEDDENETDEEV